MCHSTHSLVHIEPEGTVHLVMNSRSTGKIENQRVRAERRDEQGGDIELVTGAGGRADF